MILGKEINKRLQSCVLGGAKVPHSTSFPVLYKEDEKLYLAVFVFFFTKDDIEEGKINRPTFWAIADVETGEILEERKTKDKEFSDASYDIKYNIRMDDEYNVSKGYYDEAFEILDSCRNKIINNGKFYKGEYKYYLDKIISKIPLEYRRFYYDLSV